MRSISKARLAVLIAWGMMALSLRAEDYLKNADFAEGSQLWHGDAQEAYLKPDGTEGEATDPGAVAVLRIALSPSQSRSVYQEYQPKDTPKALHIKVEVMASIDFKRSKFAEDYTSGMDWKPGETYYWGPGAVPNVDFWLGCMPEYFMKTASLKPNEWVTVDAQMESVEPSDGRSVFFSVPPGTGLVYIKKPSVTK